MMGKVIVLKGMNLLLEKLMNVGVRIIEKEVGKVWFIFDDDIKMILLLL